ncbi:Rieske 2Fe-2S domain-containing protein [Actinomadura graeca]|uniref:Rieske 2Fe-2S domain-containing protein n=1 Tax=Actinomadura graeca TaxID=2750812 RepID=A0ABX8QQT8_9ACTN|nr:Rieske 2Fe-2S domain-containing protein [Actinomadura graeca]QXJ21149.1 Rieske 2Fe-2S domain-containing protein [Actinomadura graeca]
MPTDLDERPWPSEDNSRIPNWVYSDPDNYRRELDRIFYGPFWSFVGLACEIPEPGDYMRSVVGEKSVLVTRSADGEIGAVLNICSHRGLEVCRDKFGHGRELMCPYHQWTYDLRGDLIGVPFRRGVKGKGGYPRDFDPADHGLRRLRVETVNGAVFATFDENAPAMRDYLGEEIWARLTRVFDGRALEVLGYHRQRVRANWKLYPENMKDSYHASLLHVFLISFGLYRIDQKGELLQDPRTRAHNVVSSIRNDLDDVAGTEEMRSLKRDFQLNDMRPLASVKEYDDDVTIQIVTMFPAFTVQQQNNLLQCRNVVVKGPEEFELVWTFFGYAGDDADLRRRRVRMANLVGAAGLISIDDTEVFEFSRAGMSANPDRNCVVELGGRGIEPPVAGDMVSEGPIRGFYDLYRRIMYDRRS